MYLQRRLTGFHGDGSARRGPAVGVAGVGAGGDRRAGFARVAAAPVTGVSAPGTSFIARVFRYITAIRRITAVRPGTNEHSNNKLVYIFYSRDNSFDSMPPRSCLRNPARGDLARRPRGTRASRNSLRRDTSIRKSVGFDEIERQRVQAPKPFLAAILH